MLNNSIHKLATCLLRRFKSDCPQNCCFVTPEMEKYLQCRKDIKLEMCIIDENMIDPCWEQPEIIIIGAGLAGLSAAQRLAVSGMTKFKILEATHRAGGRIHSSMFGNVPVEIGSTFIEGGSLSNPVYTLASQEGLISKPPVKQNPFAGLCMTSCGNDIPFYIAQAAISSFHSITNKAAELYVTAQKVEDCGNLFDYLCKQMDQELVAFPFKYRDYASRVMLSEMIALKNKVGSCLHDVSAKYFGSYAELNGGRVRIPSGMIGLLAPLLRIMPECETITYCKPVSQVLWSAKEEYEDAERKKRKARATVVCCDGTTYTADYVIVTVPLGVLQKNVDTMFVPPLPEDKTNSIKRLGYGHVNHVYFEYNRPFWVWEEGCIRPCWRLDELMHNVQDWIRGISAIEEVTSSQQLLSVTVSHEAAKCVEQLSEHQLAEDFTRMIRQCLDDPTIPYPANVLATKWTSCPYSFGAKTYMKQGANVSDICEYLKTVPDECQPEIPVLFFAGEGSEPGAYGTMHGARISGVREAEKIINITKKFQGVPKTAVMETICEEAIAASSA